MCARSRVLELTAAALSLTFVPRALADTGAFDASRLAPSVAIAIDRDEQRPEGEWGLVTDEMAILGLGQIVLAHPETRERWVPVMEKAARHMMRPSQRAFATRAWGSDGLDHLGDARGEAWLGWPDLALSMLRLVHPETPLAGLNDRITDTLERRLSRAPHGLIETYPGQSFPTDVAACVAAIALRARATSGDRSALVSAWTHTFRATWIDPTSGYLWQQGDARTGAHRDAPRGSGTAVTAYFLSFADPDLSRDLTLALERHQASILGFSAIREYAEGYDGTGDIDSGPVVLGTSVTATGFAIGAALANGRSDLATRLLRTARSFGVSAPAGAGFEFAAGGPLGNAILLAQLTAVTAHE